MQHVICIKWSADNKYILSGSDEMNIRLWKANASEKLGVVSPASSSLYYFSFCFSSQAQSIPSLKYVAVDKQCVCQVTMYDRLYLPPVLMMFEVLAAFFETTMALGQP